MAAFADAMAESSPALPALKPDVMALSAVVSAWVTAAAASDGSGERIWSS